MKRLILILVVILFVGTASAEIKRYDVPSGGSPAFGPPDAGVTIIEFIDYQ
ncbi:MAG TPA: hypothetical protein VMB78_02165 [Dissulfurispiraceae bacterium]|nr:hypothetical protein [Dissulfurispiraceae bacterium]